MKEGDKERRREGDELMELLLGIFFALWWREASERPLVCGHRHPAGRPVGLRSCKKLTPPLFANLKSHGNLRNFIVITSL